MSTARAKYDFMPYIFRSDAMNSPWICDVLPISIIYTYTHIIRQVRPHIIRQVRPYECYTNSFDKNSLSNSQNVPAIGNNNTYNL